MPMVSCMSSCVVQRLTFQVHQIENPQGFLEISENKQLRIANVIKRLFLFNYLSKFINTFY